MSQRSRFTFWIEEYLKATYYAKQKKIDVKVELIRSVRNHVAYSSEQFNVLVQYKTHAPGSYGFVGQSHVITLKMDDLLLYIETKAFD